MHRSRVKPLLCICVLCSLAGLVGGLLTRTTSWAQNAGRDAPPVVHPLAAMPGIRAALPPVTADRFRQVLVFIAEPPAGAEPFERRLGSAEALPRLADELDAAMLFTSPQPTPGGTYDVQPLWVNLRRNVVKHPAMRPVVTFVGCGSGAVPAMELFTRDPSLADVLVLVDPAPVPEAVAAAMTKQSLDDRPCLILASPAAVKGAEAAKAALLRRCEKAVVVEAALGDNSAFPLAHIATLLKWSSTEAQLRRGSRWAASAAIPRAGATRIDALHTLLGLRGLAKDAQASLDTPLALREADAAPPVDKDGAFFAQIQERMKPLARLIADVAASADARLEQAKGQAKEQVASLQLEMQRANAAQQEIIHQRFADENFPWPEILTNAPPPGPAAAPGIRKADFLNVMQRSCVRCHQVCGTVEGMVGNGWIRPGNPAASRTYTVIGVHKKPGATYHNLPDKDKTIVRDFIQQMGR